MFILSFISLILGNILVKRLLCGISEIFLPLFSCRTFMVSQLIFKSFIHLEFIFVYGISLWLSFIFLHAAVHISQHHLLNRLFLLHFMFLPPLSNINWPYWHGFVSGFVPWYMCVFFANTRLFWLQWPCNIVYYQVLWSLLLSSSSSKLLWLFVVTYGPI